MLEQAKKLLGIGGEDEDATTPENQETRDKVLSWVNETWQHVKNAFNIYHQNVWRARLFQVGEFYIELDDRKQNWQPKTKADDFTPTPRINRYAPAIEAVQSNFATVPEVEAVPFPKDDERAMGIAEVCNNLIEYLTKENALRADFKNKEDLCGDASMNFVLAGCVYTDTRHKNIKLGQVESQASTPMKAWQCLNCDIYQRGPSAGGVCPICGQPVEEIDTEGVEPVKDEMGNPVMEDVIRREVRIQLADSLEIFPKPGAKRMNETPYLVRAKRMFLDDVFFEYDFEAQADAEFPDDFNINGRNRLNYYYVGYNAAEKQERDSCLVLEIFCEPNRVRKFPDGFFAVVINKKLAYYNTWNEEFVEHPLTMGAYEQLPGVFHPRSLAFDLTEIVAESCDYESLVKLHAMTSAVEPIVADKRTTVSEITGRSDKIIWWNSLAANAKEPHRMQHGQLDDGVYKQMDNLKLEIENISKAVEVMRGKQPGSITANVALQTLRGQAELQYAKPVSNWTALWKETTRKAVKVIQRDYTFVQLVEILGEECIQQIEDFMGCDLDKDVVFKSTQGGMPRTKAELKQEFVEMFDRGALDLSDPKVKEKIFELFGDTGAMNTFNEDARRARKNVRDIQNGQARFFRPQIDDPDIHLGIAKEAAKSLSFDRWSEVSKMMLYGYIEQINMAVAQLRQAAAMEMAMTAPPGTGNQPPGGGTPSRRSGQGSNQAGL